MRYVAVGDIHGMREALDALLERLAPILEPDDQLVFLGDYIDRGPDSRGVINRLIDLAAERPGTVFLRGNHEQMMLDSRRWKLPTMDWACNGSDATLRSYGTRLMGWTSAVPGPHWAFLAASRLMLETDHYVFVHAGVDPRGVAATTARTALWTREPFLSCPPAWEQTVVFGHTIHRWGPLVRPGKIGIDTGAYTGGPLTAVLLNANTAGEPVFVSVQTAGGTP